MKPDVATKGMAVEDLARSIARTVEILGAGCTAAMLASVALALGETAQEPPRSRQRLTGLDR